MLYTFSLYGAIYQLYLYKKKKRNKLNSWKVQASVKRKANETFKRHVSKKINKTECWLGKNNIDRT